MANHESEGLGGGGATAATTPNGRTECSHPPGSEDAGHEATRAERFVAAGVGSEAVRGGRWNGPSRVAGWARGLGHGPFAGLLHRAFDGARPSGLPSTALHSIGEAVRMAIAPDEIGVAYRVVNLSRGRDRELWLVETRLGPR